MGQVGVVELEGWAAELGTLHERIAGRFVRSEPRERVAAYLRGLLAGVERKNGWQLAEHAGEAAPDGMQRLLSTARWDPDELRDDLRGYVAERLGDPDAVLLITSPAGDEGFDYLVELERQAKELGVRLAYAADRFAPDHEGKPIRPAHSLHDAYLAADLITYPSLYEGFGNALIEAVFYGVPVLVNRYPVYDADIRPLGLRFIEIDGAITDATVEEVRSLLANPRRIRENARHNFEIGREHLSYKLLRRRLGKLLRELVPTP